MAWIEGLTRTPDGFALETISTNGDRRLQPLSALSSRIRAGETRRSRIQTDCTEWRTASAAPFWELLGLCDRSPVERHTVFEVRTANARYLIPASVLIGALVRPIQHMQNFLFRPQGLESFSTPLLGGERPRVGLHLPEYRIFGSGKRPSAGLFASYSWMHCFPSARAMWASVYAAANRGSLSLSLPAASLSITLHSLPWRDSLLVMDAVVMSVTASEAPFAFAQDHPRQIAFHDGATLDWAACRTAVCSIPPRDGDWSLSDEEWEAINAMLAPRARRKHALRDILDVIFTKLGTGIAWNRIDYGALTRPIAQVTYQEMRTDGRWDAIEALLSEMRMTSA